MKPSWAQQALAGLAVLFVVGVTVVGGVILALSDNPEVADQSPSATVYRIPTLVATTPVPTVIPTAYIFPTATNPLPTTAPPAVTPVVPQPTLSSPTQATCRVAVGWVPYTVQPGDTLFQIGLRYNLTVDQIRYGNCLTSDALDAGQVIFVPPVTPSLSPTPFRMTPVVTGAATMAVPQASAAPTATETPISTATPPGPIGFDGICSDTGSTITSPTVGAILSGIVPFYGTATHPNFQFYKLEIRQEGYSTSADFLTFLTSEEQVINGRLGELDTTAFRNGEYWIRLVVVDNTGNYPERCSILYTIQN